MLDFLVVGINHVVLGLARRSRTRLLSALLRSLGLLLGGIILPVLALWAVNNTGENARESSVDGTHPSDMGYLGWARSIEKPILKILKKYGIR